MAKIQFLTILLVVTCLLDGVVSVTDKEIEDRFNRMDQQLQLKDENSDLVTFLHQQAATNKQQWETIEIMMQRIERQDVLIDEMNSRLDGCVVDDASKELIQNTTIEERVTILESQVVEIEEDLTVIDDEVTDLEVDLMELEGDVNFLFEETIIQDERIFTLEQTTIAIDAELDSVDDELGSLQDATLALDFRVTILEENGGGDGNSSVADLEVRVETLEGTATDHETRLTTTENDINDLEGVTSSLETRLTTAEQDIQGLQITDVELDERVAVLEESCCGSGNLQNDTITFHTALTSYDTIPTGSAVLFNEVLLNEGGGYDSTTGTFTVPPGGDGFYYFSIYLTTISPEFSFFDIEINGQRLCTAMGDSRSVDSSFDRFAASCSGVAEVFEGDAVEAVFKSGTDETPLFVTVDYYYSGFTGFRI